MMGKYEAENMVNENGDPTCGTVRGVGLSIDWQDGPLGRGAERKEPNGAFVETVIDAVRQRIEFYQASRFKCRENALAPCQDGKARNGRSGRNTPGLIWL